MNTIYKSILLGAIFLIVGCKSEKEGTREVEVPVIESTDIRISKKQFESSGMINGQLEKRQFVKTITVNGKLKLPNKSKAVVSSIMSGTIGSINLLEGQWIQKGQALFTVTNPELIDLQEEYFVLQSESEYLKEEQLRKQKLMDENLSPKHEFLLAQSNYRANQARYKTIGQKLKMYGINVNNVSIDMLSTALTIYAPISGYVSSINAMRGQYIDPSTEVVMIASSSNLYLELNVLEKDASLVTKDQEITFSVAGLPSKKHVATVYLISPSISESGMVVVHCKISDVKELRPGMYAIADLILENYESNALPEEALVQIDGKGHVLVQSSDSNDSVIYQPYRIEVGAIENGYIEVVGDKELLGKKILVKGGYYLVN